MIAGEFPVKRTVAFFLVLLFWGCASVGQAQKVDLQYWAGQSVNWKCAKEWSLNLDVESYFKDDASDYYYQHVGIGFLYSGFAKWLDVGGAYQHTLNESDSDWNREARPYLTAILKTDLEDWSFSNRSRWEYRGLEDATDYWRYRNKTTVRFPWKWTKREIRPFLADEIFVRLDQGQFTENRLCEGFSMALTDQVGLEIYYMWRRLKSSGAWRSQNVLGTQVKVSF